MGLTGSYETGRIAQAQVRPKCANSIPTQNLNLRILVETGPVLKFVLRHPLYRSGTRGATPRNPDTQVHISLVSGRMLVRWSGTEDHQKPALNMDQARPGAGGAAAGRQRWQAGSDR